jgi:hypothetical protein
MSRRVFGIWCFALGAGVSSLLALLVTYTIQGSPQWWRVLVKGEGWTLYPPLSTVSDTFLSGLASRPAILIAFNPVVAYATLSGAVFLAAWLFALVLGKKEKAHFSHWFWLSWLCLLPLTVHLYGNKKLADLMSQTAIQVQSSNANYLDDIYIAGQALSESSIDSVAPRQKDTLNPTPTDTTALPF